MTPPDPVRRRLLQAAAAGSLLGRAALARAQAAPDPVKLRAAPVRVALLGAPYPDTDVWAYNGTVPGPLLRLRQGDTLRVSVANGLDAPTTVHWHGLRLPNRMDGVPHVTQPPIAPGGTFDYEFACPDAGTFWYHPHASSSVQVDMGLHGLLIVDEPSPPAVDRDVAWAIDDWRLRRDGSVTDDFGSMFDASHAGRLGNTVTINGRLPDRFAVEAGERIRLRLANVANARIFALRFEGHSPVVIAIDGMPCEPHVPQDGRLLLGPGMRADVILDATGAPGTTHRVVDEFVAREAYEVVALAYREDRRARPEPLSSRVALPPNPVPAPDLASAIRHRMVFAGGMGGMMGGRGMMGGGMMGGMAGGHVWSINGKSATESDHSHAPLLTLERNSSHVLELVNDTMWWHPIHLHGHSFRIVSRDGRPLARTIVADTSLLPPRSRAEIAFVADNPGDWMFHCHVLEHQASGMMATIRVA
ncbi:MAG: multicopper oxidase family protein [Betaproteobacteria bacterium]|nr:multicopper oxidase family protein [Betaproteobacteria bacterium]